jgi:hypothetical protein
MIMYVSVTDLEDGPSLPFEHNKVKEWGACNTVNLCPKIYKLNEQNFRFSTTNNPVIL